MKEIFLKNILGTGKPTRSALRRNQRIAIGRTAPPVAEILTFDDPDPRPEQKKRKSQVEQLGIPKPEKRKLTEDEQIKVDELASEFSSFLRPEKSDDFWKGLDFGSAF